MVTSDSPTLGHVLDRQRIEQLGNQPVPGVRQWGLDASLFKAVPVTERLVPRANPSSIGGDGILGTFTSGQGARELQLTLRVTW